MSQLDVTLDYYAPQGELTPKALAAAGDGPNNDVWAPRSPLQTNGKVNPMKTLCLVSLGTVLTLGVALGGCSQTPKTETAATSEVVTLRSETVEVACGMCVYGMEGVQGSHSPSLSNAKTRNPFHFLIPTIAIPVAIESPWPSEPVETSTPGIPLCVTWPKSFPPF